MHVFASALAREASAGRLILSVWKTHYTFAHAGRHGVGDTSSAFIKACFSGSDGAQEAESPSHSLGTHEASAQQKWR
jgi:hypothetical protein